MWVTVHGLWVRVQGSWVRGQVLWIRVQGLWVRAQGLWVRVHVFVGSGAGFKFDDLWSMVCGLGCRVVCG